MVLLAFVVEEGAETIFTVLKVEEFYLGADQVVVSWQNVELGDRRLLYRFLDLTHAQQYIVDGGDISLEFHPNTARCVSLRVAIDQQTAFSGYTQGSRKINRGGSFPHPPLAISNADDSTHRRFPYHIQAEKKSAPESRKNEGLVRELEVWEKNLNL
jgi:hypothetical protein